jgi:hypothetical protein
VTCWSLIRSVFRDGVLLSEIYDGFPVVLFCFCLLPLFGSTCRILDVSWYLLDIYFSAFLTDELSEYRLLIVCNILLLSSSLLTIMVAYTFLISLASLPFPYFHLFLFPHFCFFSFVSCFFAVTIDFMAQCIYILEGRFRGFFFCFHWLEPNGLIYIYIKYIGRNLLVLRYFF